MKSLVTLFTFLLLTQSSYGKTKTPEAETKYKTIQNNCPATSSSKLTLVLLKEFENNHSLKDLKEKIIKENLQDKYFISNYQIEYNPLEKVLQLKYECPTALMNVQIMRNAQNEHFQAILTEEGKLVDPTYEILLRQEKKLTYTLPNLAVPSGEVDKIAWPQFADLFKDVRLEFRRRFSELILNDASELTIILSVDGRPSSVFMGTTDWKEKLEKLDKIVSYMQKRNKIPVIINLTNAKKVVVKF